MSEEVVEEPASAAIYIVDNVEVEHVITPELAMEEVVESSVLDGKSSQDIITEGPVQLDESSVAQVHESSEQTLSMAAEVQHASPVAPKEEDTEQDDFKRGECDGFQNVPNIQSSNENTVVTTEEIDKYTDHSYDSLNENAAVVLQKKQNDNGSMVGSEVAAKETVFKLEDKMDKSAKQTIVPEHLAVPAGSDSGYGRDTVDVAKVVETLGKIVKSVVPRVQTKKEQIGNNETKLTGDSVAEDECGGIPDVETKIIQEKELGKPEKKCDIREFTTGPVKIESNVSTPRRRGRPRKSDSDTACIVYHNKDMCFQVMHLLKNQREEGNYCDVVIHIQGCQYWAHRCVLSASSSYFDTTLKQNRFTSGSAVEQVTLPCEDRTAFEAVLDYMYTGKLTINLRNVSELLNLADKISLDIVKKYCQEHLGRNISFRNWQLVKEIAAEYSLEDTLEKVYCFLLDHIESLPDEDILSMTHEEMADFLRYSGSSSSKIVLMNQENHKLLALMHWVQHNITERQPAFDELLQSIDPLMLGLDVIEKYFKKPEWTNSPLIESSCLRGLLDSVKMQQKNKQEEEKSTRAQRAKKVLSESDDYVGGSSVVIKHSDDDVTIEGFEDMTNAEQPGPSSILSSTPEQPVKRKRGRPRKNETPQSQLTPTVTKTLRSTPVVSGKRKRGRPRKSETLAYSGGNKSSMETKEETGNISDGEDHDEVWDVHSQEEYSSTKELDAEYSPRKTKRKRKASNPMRFQMNDPDAESVDKSLLAASPRTIGGLFKCIKAGCKFTSKHKANYEDHINVHEGIRAHICPICNKGFFSRKHMRRHQDIHLGHKGHMCEFCGYASYRPDKLRHHMQRIHPEAALERGWISQATYEALKTPKPRGGKRRIFHPGDTKDSDGKSPEGPYKCKKCDLSFPSIRDLDTHRKNHGRSREYLCEDCGFSSSNYKSITVHKKKHKGDVHRCTYEGCNFQTVFKDTFQDHLKRHIGVKEHMCSHCGKAYTTRKDMRRHEKTHFEVNVVQCPACDYSTTRRDNLNDHIRRHHPTKAAAMGMKFTRSSQRNLTLRPRGARKPKLEGSPTESVSSETIICEEVPDDVVQRQVRLVSEQVIEEHRTQCLKEDPDESIEAVEGNVEEMVVGCAVETDETPMIVQQHHGDIPQQVVTIARSQDEQQVAAVNPRVSQGEQLTWTFWSS